MTAPLDEDGPIPPWASESYRFPEGPSRDWFCRRAAWTEPSPLGRWTLEYVGGGLRGAGGIKPVPRDTCGPVGIGDRGTAQGDRVGAVGELGEGVLRGPNFAGGDQGDVGG